MIHLEIQMELAGLHRRLMVVDRVTLNADQTGLLRFKVEIQGEQYEVKPVDPALGSLPEKMLYVYELAEMTLLQAREITLAETEIMAKHIARAIAGKVQRLDALLKLSA
jgi:hypothetical protein